MGKLQRQVKLLNVILYGAGNRAGDIYAQFKNSYEFISIADKDKNKHGKFYTFADGVQLPILPIKDLLVKYPKTKILITPDAPVKYEIINELLSDFGIEKNRILDYVSVAFRRTCLPIEEMLIFGDKNISACCTTSSVPTCQYDDSISDEALYELIEKFKKTIASALDCNNAPPQCINCSYINSSYWAKVPKIREINLTAGSMCQFKCIYCSNRDGSLSKNFHQSNLERVLKFINYLKNTCKITELTHFSVANGEITINPLREKVFDAISGFPCSFYTNGEIYSEEISEFLKLGNSKVNISVDAGTSKTFSNIKGIDSFENVVDTIIKYGKCGDIELKYIVLPGLNDNQRDVEGFIKLAAHVNATVIVSRDANNTDAFDANIQTCLDTVSMIISKARENGLRLVNIMNAFRDQSKFKDNINSLFTI